MITPRTDFVSTLRRAHLTWVTGFALIIGVSVSSAQATVVLDQDYEPGIYNSHATINKDIDHAQTFTVGITGILDSIDVYIQRSPQWSDPLLVHVRPTAGGLPLASDASSLAATSVPGAGIPTSPGFVSIDLSAANLLVTAGEVLAIVLQNNTNTGNISSGAYTWEGHAPSAGGGNPALAYPLGQGYARTLTSPNWSQFTPSDRAFRTYVEIPLPGAVLLAAPLILAVTARRPRH